MGMRHGILGGNWNNSAICGSRTSIWDNSPLSLYGNDSARGVADTAASHLTVAGPNGLLADSFTLLRSSKEWTAKHATTAPHGLVGKPNVRAGGLQ